MGGTAEGRLDTGVLLESMLHKLPRCVTDVGPNCLYEKIISNYYFKKDHKKVKPPIINKFKTIL